MQCCIPAVTIGFRVVGAGDGKANGAGDGKANGARVGAIIAGAAITLIFPFLYMYRLPRVSVASAPATSEAAVAGLASH